jgi:hypothetical protein
MGIGQAFLLLDIQGSPMFSYNFNMERDMDETLDTGLEVQDLTEDDNFEPIGLDLGKRWQGQLRRAGSPRELPRPQGYNDYPVWLTVPAKMLVEELTVEEAEA